MSEFVVEVSKQHSDKRNNDYYILVISIVNKDGMTIVLRKDFLTEQELSILKLTNLVTE